MKKTEIILKNYFAFMLAAVFFVSVSCGTERPDPDGGPSPTAPYSFLTPDMLENADETDEEPEQKAMQTLSISVPIHMKQAFKEIIDSLKKLHPHVFIRFNTPGDINDYFHYESSRPESQKNNEKSYINNLSESLYTGESYEPSVSFCLYIRL
ncbi:MAG: hypothetical protein FWE82_03525 [Defluviitaleaceae bacterium]|nr:hypothetical protein [Defluviitaleaceae bacterium]